MSIPYFLGGALAGAGILTGLALLDDRRAAKMESPGFTPESAARMGVNEVCRHLNVYFMKSNMLSLTCNSVFLDSSSLGLNPLVLKDDRLLQKARNRAEGFVTRAGRNIAFTSLKGVKADMEKLFARYRPVFVRANRLLAAQGVMGVRLGAFTLSQQPFTVNNEISNDNWLEDFAALCDRLRDFVTATGEACERLITLLEGEDPDAKTMIEEAGLPEDCVPVPSTV